MPGGIHPTLEVFLSWPPPNLVDPETRPNTMTILACVLGPITLALFLARFWVRTLHQRNAGWDDWIMLAAMILTMALTVMLPIAGANYFNRHVWDLDPLKNSRKIVTARKYVLALECLFCTASGLIKISILLFYRRLAARAVSTFFRWATWITIGMIVAYTIALTIAPIVGCQPIEAYWEQVDITKRLQGYKFHCFDEGADVVAASILSAIQDLITAILPTFLYWNLQIPMRQKVALFGIFAIGYGGVALGGLRAYYSWRTFYETYDVIWSTWDLMLTSLLELHVGCFCANAPSLKVFFKHFFHAKLTSFSRSRSVPRSKDRKDSAMAGSKSSKGTLGKMKSFLTTSHSTTGYISEPHNSVSVDMHGGVQVQKEIHISHSPSSPRPNARHESVTTTDMIYDQYSDDDIELGRYTTGHNSQASSMGSTRNITDAEISALPPMPTSPVTTSWPMRSPTSFLSFTTQLPQVRDAREPRLPAPAAISEEVEGDGRRPGRSTSRGKGVWRTGA
ncbi:hypothetical protein CC86DRAFT_401479 [Ophiobolus disseminans]|uniref:Rhodopsin domain-containing protein n=1 Tax=Ophiobolus disseminans TaxID=1469910 RepID=A0A6A7AHG0_9PLEO|nr:hypothetical protein CC86DRAFT_401479 [Ophiobolus disseminans]